MLQTKISRDKIYWTICLELHNYIKTIINKYPKKSIISYEDIEKFLEKDIIFKELEDILHSIDSTSHQLGTLDSIYEDDDMESDGTLKEIILKNVTNQIKNIKNSLKKSKSNKSEISSVLSF